MIRAIVSFHADESGEWVAELSCLHSQHVRHQPPFRQREWVTTPAGRVEKIGSEIDCPLCDRAELPEGLRIVRTAGPFDAGSVPKALRTAHRIAGGTWGVLRLIEGGAGIQIATTPPIDRWLTPGGAQPIPPLVPHHLMIDGAVVLAVDFLVADPETTPPELLGRRHLDAGSELSRSTPRTVIAFVGGGRDHFRSRRR